MLFFDNSQCPSPLSSGDVAVDLSLAYLAGKVDDHERSLIPNMHMRGGVVVSVDLEVKPALAMNSRHNMLT